MEELHSFTSTAKAISDFVNQLSKITKGYVRDVRLMHGFIRRNCSYDLFLYLYFLASAVALRYTG